MVKLLCSIIGAKGSVFAVDIDASVSAGDLKEAIKAKKPNDLKYVDADMLQLFLGKTTDGKWLPSNDPNVVAMQNGSIPDEVQNLLVEQIDSAEEIADVFVPALQKEEVHVLVVVPSCCIDIVIRECGGHAEYVHELTRYRHRGMIIQRNCRAYCQQILDKIDDLYRLPERPPLPFICVIESSGMGKSQLAFALGGRRLWFYWFTTPIGTESQFVYQNFSSISGAFLNVTDMDGPTKKSERDILNSASSFYTTDCLWTYGFIHALLEYCSKDENQHGQMIRFKEKTSFVDKCNRDTVIALCEKMKAKRKILPFFVLDEMTPNINIDGGGKNLAAFQRNVFRVCGLVVVVIGYDFLCIATKWSARHSIQRLLCWVAQ